jgi:hypothetical protein
MNLTLGAEEIHLLSNYAHWIPAKKGITDDYMQETYPGWKWDDLIPKMLKQGIITISPEPADIKLMQGLWLKLGIKVVKASKNKGVVAFIVEYI